MLSTADWFYEPMTVLLGFARPSIFSLTYYEYNFNKTESRI